MLFVSMLRKFMPTIVNGPTVNLFLCLFPGMWYSILNFVNLIGVISNGFLIAFTSSWASKYSLSTKLWICIGFEVGSVNICFVKRQ